jgi:alginate O-acetyltransferase complex protein AlgI
MVFSSSIFLVFFLPLLLITYYLADRKYRNIVLLLFSFVFYSWGAPKFVFVIFFTTLLDFQLVRWMGETDVRWKRRLLLMISVGANLGLLIYFKYSNFFIENINAFLHALDIREISWLKLVLPIGISFYTFETITYVVDVYRKVHAPLKNFWEYQLYIILFPKLIAGPIIRYHEIADQITDRSENDTIDYKLTGFIRFAIGLSKKVLIANVLGEMADEVFSKNPASLTGFAAWIGIVSYTFQIYFDFSGYSDMAIGLGKMLGFRFPENFNNPYTSQSITEFWRRWHITLGAWMRNYLYIPLGGNRVGSRYRLYFNLWLVFLASGLWHGASWNFIFWGAYHGFFLVAERGIWGKINEKIGKFPRVLITFLIVMIGWVFFRLEHFHDSVVFIKTMFGFSGGDVLPDLSGKFFTFLLLAFLFSFAALAGPGLKLQHVLYGNTHSGKRYAVISTAAVLLFMICLSSITSQNFNPFIYFRF